MKKIYSYVVSLLCIVFMAFLSGCGEEPQQYFELQVEKKEFYDVAKANEGMYAFMLKIYGEFRLSL